MHRKWTHFFKDHGKFYLIPHDDFKEVMKYLKDERVYNVIDVGCGSGRHLISLAENGFNVTGIDFSPAAGQLAEHWLTEKGLEGKVYVADFRKELNSFKTDEFDAAIAVNSLQYVEDEKMYNNVLAEINRIVKTDGIIFITIPSEQSLIIQPDVTQMFYDKEKLEATATNYFEIIDLYKDKEKAWVIMAKNKSNNQEEIKEEKTEQIKSN